MTITAQDQTATAEVDVLIVGAGLSGIGAACHLQNEAPGSTYEVLEARSTSGGTWNLFRYPGIRSDSDMYTLGYRFKPWEGPTSIGQGTDILDYIRATAVEHDVERHIRYGRRVVSADWSAKDARWSVTVEDVETEETSTRRCRFLYLCSGYYRYDGGYTPDWAGLADFDGTVIHPQAWPSHVDLTGKKVVVVGSGATAVTLVPELAQTAEKVTMLQRSPSYLLAMPAADPIADVLRKVLPAGRAYAAIRWKNIRMGTALYGFCRKRPERAKWLLRHLTVRGLPAGFDVDTHFSPAYGPWEQRMCMSPDGTFYAAVREGRADIVTDHIDIFTPDGRRDWPGDVMDIMER